MIYLDIQEDDQHNCIKSTFLVRTKNGQRSKVKSFFNHHKNFNSKASNNVLPILMIFLFESRRFSNDDGNYTNICWIRFDSLTRMTLIFFILDWESIPVGKYPSHNRRWECHDKKVGFDWSILLFVARTCNMIHWGNMKMNEVDDSKKNHT